MAEGAVTYLLEKVKEVVEEYKDLIISGAKNELELLHVELGSMKAFLEEAAKKKKKEKLFRELESQIRDGLYDVEDAVDIWLTDRIQARATNSRRPALPVSNQTEEVIKSIREEKLLPLIQDVKLKFETMQIIDGSGDAQDLQTSLTRNTPISQTRVVGHEDEEKTITGYLTEETKDLDVISIIGAPGQGKTTLAWKIFQNKFICYHFPIRIWVCISQQLNIKDVFIHILRKFMPSQDMFDLKDDELAPTVTACLKDQKFLLVLDDVWNFDDWNKIKEVLPLRNGNGKVLITSREMDVGAHTPDYRRAHKLRLLTDEESWMLLQFGVFENLVDCPSELSGVGEDIAAKCGGVPLTVVVLGGVLMDVTRSQTTSKAKEEWEMLAKNVSGAILKDKEHRITNVVALSYDRVPDDLKDCFLYLGVFPEDYEFPVKMLMELWIAEGFILPKNGRSLEETAEDNLNDLIQRNLLKVEKTNHMCKVKTCRVHDMIRAFCINKSIEENLYHEIKTGDVDSQVQNSRRLCCHSDLSMFLCEKPNGPHVRSFLCFYEQPLDVELQYTSFIPDGFSKLRILGHSIKFHLFPAKVIKLIHLRYLTLFVDNLTFIPKAISELWNLHTLTVATNCNSIVMKASMRKMIQLRHLRTNAVVVMESKLEGNVGKNLQTLNRLSPESCTEAISESAVNLKTLGIYGKLANLSGANFFEKLHNLENLKLVNTLVYETKSEDLLHSLPQWNHFPPKLKRLTLRNTYLDWQKMSTLATINSLEVLKLKDNAFVGVSWEAAGYVLPNLQLLLIVNTDLVQWKASGDTFPSLRYLVVESCESLEEIPECLGTHLVKLDIERVPHSAVQSGKKIEEAKKGKAIGKFAVQFDLNIGPGCATK